MDAILIQLASDVAWLIWYHQNFLFFSNSFLTHLAGRFMADIFAKIGIVRHHK